jgi:penicillin amidase
MGVILRWLFRIAVAAVALCVLAVLGVYYLASRSLPDYQDTHQVAGLNAPVEIVRDNANVPHILGTDDRDVFFGLGYAHAQDRLWQMTMLRRTAQGRLSELFGEATFPIDELLRRLDIYTLATRSVAAQDVPTQAALEAYAAGVNAWMTKVNQDALGRGAPEFFLFSGEIAPWQPADSIALVKLMSLQLSSHLEEEVLRARVTLALDDPARLRDILPDVPGTGAAALPEYSALFPNLPRYARNTHPDPHPLSPFKDRAFAGASNAWAAAPVRSANGGTLLANDPHLGFTAPTLWYLARLELSSGPVIGATIPGIPLTLVGRSDALGWGLTSSYLDDQDVYIEEFDPDDPTQYRTPDGWTPFLTRQTIINVKDSDPVTLILRWTENGPVLPGTFRDLATITPPNHVATVAWTALSDRDTSMTGGIRLMASQTIDQAIEASALYVAPSQNLTLIDGDTIAMRTIGHMPRRDANHQTEGRLPSPGWIAENRWSGVYPASANPEFLRPSGGLVGNTNNKTVDRPFPLHVSHSWGDSQRVNRWRGLMQSREVHTRDSFIEAQLDTVSFTARSLLPLVGADLWFTGQAAPPETTDGKRQRALRLLSEWNGEMNEHLPEPLIYAAWMRALQTRLIQDDLGPLTSEFSHVEPLFIERVYRDIDGASVWCDIQQSAAIESCTDIARLALDDAIVFLDERYGVALESLRWGDAHLATHDHQVLGEVPLLNWFVNIQQSTSGGDNTLLRGRTSGQDPDPFHNVHGAGYRGVYDLADPDGSVFVTSTGQSGHFLSRHYDDLGELWRRGEYVPMSLDLDLARAASVGVTQLLPVTE